MPVQLRPFRSEDAKPCLGLFHETIHRINIRDYTKDQIDAWAPADYDQESWASRFNDRFAHVACDGTTIVGFGDMTRDGHLDRLFVSTDYQRQGIARLLVERLLENATSAGLSEITTEASITAQPLFDRMGFEVVREQSVNCRGVDMTNFRMRRVLTAA